jgi:hypothetical protein
MQRTVVVIAAVAVITLGLVLWSMRASPVSSSSLDPATTVSRQRLVVRGGAERVSAIDGGRDAGPSLPHGVLAQFGWGSGEGQLGRNRPQEANPEAPMSLTIDSAGRVYVVDQVNNRVVKLERDGRPAGSVPLTVQAGQDLAIAKDGTMVVMDRLVDHSLALMGPDGKLRGELPLLGKGLEEGGGSTGVFTDGNDIYVEREHGDLVKVGDTSGTRDLERPEIPGRPSRDGTAWLSATLGDRTQGQVLVTVIDKPSHAHRFTRQVVLGPPVMALTFLDSDRSGLIYLAGLVETPQSTAQAPQYALSLMCLDPLDGHPLGQVALPANESADETFRELAVSDEGGVLFLQRTENGAALVRVTCP